MKLIGTVALGWTLTAQIVFQPPLTAPPSVGGRLAAAVLLGGEPLAGLPEALRDSDRTHLSAYQERWRTFKPGGPPSGYDEPWVRRERRERLEREIVATLDRDGIEQVAHAIAWSDGPYAASPFDPQQEAIWAEGLLRDSANAPAAPYLYAFLASRYRMQFERANEDRPVLERLAKKYKTMLDRVRNAGDGLVILLADDLDSRPTLSSTATRHPREYLPDT